MLVLAIDTARSRGSVALLRQGGPADSEMLGTGPRYEEVLFGSIGRLLDRHAVDVSAVDVFAASTGPGSFTGIRVGLAAVKALAEANARPLVGVSSLRALAYACEDPAPRASVMDARRGEVFAGCFDPDAQPLLPETLCAWGELEPRLQQLDPVLVTDDPAIFQPGGPASAACGWTTRVVTGGLAGFVALLALQETERGRSVPPEAVEANYIRRASARPPAHQEAIR